jgi:hypothetical protein
VPAHTADPEAGPGKVAGNRPCQAAGPPGLAGVGIVEGNVEGHKDGTSGMRMVYFSG